MTDREPRRRQGGRPVPHFTRLDWGDEEGAVLVEALRYAAEHCAFPHGAVNVFVGYGNRITKDEAAWKELKGKFRWY